MNRRYGPRGRHVVFCAAILMMLGAAAQAEVKLCAMTEYGRSNGIGQIVLLDLAEDFSAVRVVDRYIVAKGLPPVDASITENTERRLAFRWQRASEGSSTLSRNVTVTVKFRAIYFRQSDRLKMTGQPVGFTSTWRADGQCRSLSEAERKRLSAR